MDMGPMEIAREYRTAKDQRGMISILADLNSCSSAEIKEVLISQGIKLKKYKREPMSYLDKQMKYSEDLNRKKREGYYRKDLPINPDDKRMKNLPEFMEWYFSEEKEYHKDFETEKEAIRYRQSLYQYLWKRKRNSEIILSKDGNRITVSRAY